MATIEESATMPPPHLRNAPAASLAAAPAEAPAEAPPAKKKSRRSMSAKVAATDNDLSSRVNDYVLQVRCEGGMSPSAKHATKTIRVTVSPRRSGQHCIKWKETLSLPYRVDNKRAELAPGELNLQRYPKVQYEGMRQGKSIVPPAEALLVLEKVVLALLADDALFKPSPGFKPAPEEVGRGWLPKPFKRAPPAAESDTDTMSVSCLSEALECEPCGPAPSSSFDDEPPFFVFSALEGTTTARGEPSAPLCSACCVCCACLRRADALSCAQRCSYLRTCSACCRRTACACSSCCRSSA